MYKARIKEKWWFSRCGRTWLVCRKPSPNPSWTLLVWLYIQTLSQKFITKHQWLVHSLYGQKYSDTPFFRKEKGTSKHEAGSIMGTGPGAQARGRKKQLQLPMSGWHSRWKKDWLISASSVVKAVEQAVERQAHRCIFLRNRPGFQSEVCRAI